MRFVIDTNIVISAMLRNSLTRRVIISDVFDLYAPEYLLDEIFRHRTLILKKAKISERDFEMLLALLGKHIEFVDKERYRDNLPPAEKEMEKIDTTDSPFLALALALGCRIWSDDKHLRKQSMVDVLTTDDIVLKILKIRL